MGVPASGKLGLITLPLKNEVPAGEGGAKPVAGHTGKTSERLMIFWSLEASHAMINKIFNQAAEAQLINV